mmetsp:Transcript_14414/g.27096  ORF Transcript_14414/g.27096 Transcript_14414/m.27096 type:complete len:456 (-) Transcript_14414:411-1778(-)
MSIPLASSRPPALTWFVLVDSDTGEAYRGASASAVSLSCGSVVAQFRDAVKVKHSNKLASIDAADLLVYKNRESFDRRNDPNENEKQEPLRSSHRINGLGNTEEDALVVVIPPPRPLLEFIRCEESFYNNIYKATEINGWISFGDNMPSITLNRLYIRESYRTIESNFTPRMHGKLKVIITGTPGIGKSLFLFYLLWKLVVKEGKWVLIMYGESNIYYDGKGGVCTLETIPSAANYSFWNDEPLWCLFDSKGKNGAYLGHIPYDRCNFILSTSPRRELINDFKKSHAPQYFYMPLWNQTELEAIAPMFRHVTEATWRDRFDILGGIPRQVLEDTTQNPTKMLEAACAECSLEDCMKKVGLDSTISEKSKVIHSLIHMTSIAPYTESSVCYASKTALSVIVHRKGFEAKQKLRNLLEASEGNPLTVTLCGYIFEPYAIEVLEKGGIFKCRQLVHGN